MLTKAQRGMDSISTVDQVQQGSCFKEQAVMKPDITAYFAATDRASPGLSVHVYSRQSSAPLSLALQGKQGLV